MSQRSGRDGVVNVPGDMPAAAGNMSVFFVLDFLSKQVVGVARCIDSFLKEYLAARALGLIYKYYFKTNTKVP